MQLLTFKDSNKLHRNQIEARTTSDKQTQATPKMQAQLKQQVRRAPELLLLGAAIVLVLLTGSPADAQSSKGGPQQRGRSDVGQSYATGPSTSLAQSPGAQIRQQQQQQQYSTPASIARTTQPSSSTTTKRRAQQQQQVAYNQQQQQQQQSTSNDESTTEDPLADSEPALYGSVAGAPGVDFPAYTRIPKTSFTCEGKGFDFGFYADEEAGCQVYHVCWSGRRESFLCGVGTVFNQAILACDYWHSVDCSKSSQFYGVNSELGKCRLVRLYDGGAQKSSLINGKFSTKKQAKRAASQPARVASNEAGLWRPICQTAAEVAAKLQQRPHRTTASR